MNTLSRLALASLIASSASIAQAESNIYGGMSTLIGTTEIAGAEFDTNFIQVQVGNRFNEYFALEARLGMGIGSDEISGNGARVEIEGDYVASVLAKGILPINDSVELYGLAGYTKTSLTLNASLNGDTLNTTESDADLSYGLGASFQATEFGKLFVEYNNFYDKDGISIDGFTLGFNAKF